MQTWSFQLYSARNFPLAADVPALENNLKLLADLGYSQVEGFGGIYDSARSLKTLLKNYGLTMPTGHFSLSMLRNTPEQTFRIAEELGLETLICPFLMPDERPENAEGWQQFAETLTELLKDCRQAGFGFAWHNHDFELEPLPDRQIPMKILLEYSDIDWQMDLAWIVRAKADPLTWIKNYGNRLCAVHIKDLAPEGENIAEDGWADVGFGVIDWSVMYQALKQTRCLWYVMEHDNPADLERFAKRSLATFNAFVD